MADTGPRNEQESVQERQLERLLHDLDVAADAHPVRRGPHAPEPARNEVVVGADGSDHALHAVGWAAAEARSRGVPLRIVHADARPDGAPGPAAASDDPMARAVAVARRAEPGLAVSTTRSPAEPVPALLDAASGAALLVVGMGGDAERVLVGSVALEVSARASCPVAVVRGGPVPPRGPVLVGVDTVEGDAPALTVAFADARRHGGRVVVLHARHLGDPRPTGATLHDALSPWTARFPGVPVEVTVVPHDVPASALLQAAEGARLVVVGTRAHGAYARALFGSTSREVLRRSPVSVVVVDPGAAVDEPGPAPGLRNALLDHPHDPGALF